MAWWEWLVHLGLTAGAGWAVWYYRSRAVDFQRDARISGMLAEARAARLRALENQAAARDQLDHRRDLDAATAAGSDAARALAFLRDSFRSSSS